MKSRAGRNAPVIGAAGIPLGLGRSETARYAFLHGSVAMCSQTLGRGAHRRGFRSGGRREVMFSVKKQVWPRCVGDAVRRLSDFCVIGRGRRRGYFDMGQPCGGTKSPRAPTTTIGSGLAQSSSLVLTLEVLDAGGSELQIAVWRCPGKIEVWSPAGSCLAAFNMTRLSAWLKAPVGQMVDRGVSLTSFVDGIVLGIAPLFVSRRFSQRDIGALSRFVSAADSGTVPDS